MLEISKLTIRNFFCLREFEISFQNRGLVLISGPNGSGKSSIYEAILWCLFNRTARQSRVDDVVNDIVKKDCQVIIDGYLNGKPLKVSRFRKHSVAGNDLVVVYDGENFKGSPSEIQLQLEKLVRADFNQFLLISSFIPERIRTFAAATPAQRLAILGGILDLHHFDMAYEYTRSRLKQYQVELASLEKEISVIERNLEGIKADIDYLERNKAKKKEEAEEEKHQLVLEKRRLIYRIKQVQKELERFQKGKAVDYEAEERKLKEERNELSSKLTQINGKLHSLRQQYHDLQQIEAKDYIGKPCPVCERPISKNLVHRLMQDHKRKMSVVSRQIKTAEEEKEEIENRINELQKRIEYLATEKLSQEKARIQYENELSNLRDKLSFVQNKIDSIEKDISTYDNLLKKRYKDLKKNRKEIDKLIEKQNELNHKIELYEIIKEMFGKKGIRFEYIRQVLQKLEEETQKILYVLSSSKLDLEIEVNNKEEIEIKVYRTGIKKRYEDCSSGEKHRIECALAFGLNRMARSFHLMSTNFLFLDELFDRALDVEGQEKVFEILQQMEREIETVFVVSHRPELQSQFSNVVVMRG